MIAARYHGGAQTPKAVVMHGTVSPCKRGNARAVANWWHASTSPKTSAHYVADPGESIQCVGDHTVAYHCGYNTGSIGYELSDPQTGDPKRWGDAVHTAMLKIAAKDVARLCLAYGIEIKRPSVAELKAKGPHGIYGHDDSRRAFGHTTHTDPGPDFPWAHFIVLVQAEADALTHKEKPVSGPAKTPNITAAIKLMHQTGLALQKIGNKEGKKIAKEAVAALHKHADELRKIEVK